MDKFICDGALECMNIDCFHHQPHSPINMCEWGYAEFHSCQFLDRECVAFQVEPVQTHYICYVEGTDGGKRHRHFTLGSAQTEAERLTRLTGKSTNIYEWRGTCRVNQLPVIWEMPE